MNLPEIFQESFINLPIESNGKDYLIFIADLFEVFQKKINELDSSNYRFKQSVQNKIDELCMRLYNCIYFYYDGRIAVAYRELSQGMQIILPDFNLLWSSDGFKDEFSRLYRMRVGRDYDFSKKDMFHIPFELRRKITSQRYSIPGFPCLYVSTSVYTCWEELRRPDLDYVQVSRLELSPQGKTRVLNLGNRPCNIKNLLTEVKTSKKNNEIALSFLVCWPLIASASIKVGQPNMPFKPEYIIPQMLLEWVRRNENFIGIRFFSMYIEKDYADSTLQTNYVFPVRSPKRKGHCSHLSSIFKVTDPITWRLFKTVRTFPYISQLPECDLDIIKGGGISYANTDFGSMQAALNNQKEYSLR